MASTIILSDNGVSSGSAGLKETGGNDGVLILQTTTSGGTATNALVANTGQNIGTGGVTPSTWTVFKAIEVGANGAGIAGATGQPVMFSNATYNSGWKYTATGAASNYDQLAGAHRWFYAPSGTAGNTITFVEAMRIDTSGNVSIGTTTAAGKLNIYNAGNAYFELASNGRTLGTTSMLYGQDTAGTGYVWNRDNSPVVIGTNNTTRVTVDNAGSVLLNNSAAYLYFNNTSQFIRGGGGTQVIVGASSGGFYQQVGGSYYLVTTAGGSTSDASLKTNVQQLSGALEKVCAIRGVNFEFIEEQMCTADQGTQLGVIAQEVEAQYPEIVLTNEDGIKTVRYDRLVVPLIEAIKEQQALITTLTERITALEGAQA